MASFEAVTTWQETPDGRRLEIPPSWLQGKAAFGGVQVAAGLRSIQEQVPADRPVRTVSAAFVGPTGTAPLGERTEVLRAGRSVTAARCDLLGTEGVACTVTAAFGTARRSAIVRSEPSPRLPPPEGLQELPYLPGVTPAFIQHMDLRWAEGGFPFTGNDRLDHAGWCRHRTEPGEPAGAVLALLDAWPAPALQAFRGPAPAATITWSAQILRLPDRVTVNDWFAFRARVMEAHGDGFVTMRGEMFDMEGTMIAHFEQLVAVYDRR